MELHILPQWCSRLFIIWMFATSIFGLDGNFFSIMQFRKFAILIGRSVAASSRLKLNPAWTRRRHKSVNKFIIYLFTFNDSLLLLFDLSKVQPSGLVRLVDQPRIGRNASTRSASVGHQRRPANRHHNVSETYRMNQPAVTLSVTKSETLSVHQWLPAAGVNTVLVGMGAWSTSVRGMFSFQCRTLLNILWQSKPSDPRKRIYLLSSLFFF